MIVGHVRDSFPRVILSLSGREGPVSVEFVIDTGFEGELALPYSTIRSLDAEYIGPRNVIMADGSMREAPHYIAPLEWDEGVRRTEIVELDGRPLAGNVLFDGFLIQIEMTDGGEVVIEPL